jgi:PleD family two-component response regulator
MTMQSELTPETPGAGPNVLIVDDSAMMRKLIKRVTSVVGVPIGTIFEAANGREALRSRARDISSCSPTSTCR